MTTDLSLLLGALMLYWIGLMLPTNARLLRNGIAWGVGNREASPPDPPWVARATRAHANLSENMLMFVPLMLMAHAVHPDAPHAVLGGYVFLGARAVYLTIYVVGVPYLRTLLWATSVAGMGLVVASLLG